MEFLKIDAHGVGRDSYRAAIEPHLGDFLIVTQDSLHAAEEKLGIVVGMKTDEIGAEQSV